MIEFKAECGHVVRVQDDSGGDVVRCSYCGQKIRVPVAESSDLDYLYKDVEQSDEPPERRRRKRRKPRRKPVSAGRQSRGIDLVSVILRMCYAAFLLMIVIFVGGRYVLPHFGENEANPTPVEVITPEQDEPEARSESLAVEPLGREGLMTRHSAIGLYVDSVPKGAAAYCLEVSRVPETGRIYDSRGVIETVANGTWLTAADGTYVVEVALPWNDVNLSDPDLPYHDQYRAFRRAIEHASAEEREDLVEAYFVPDGATAAFVDETDDQIYIVRRYEGVRVRNGRSRGVRALFLPRIAGGGSETFSLSALINDYFPKQEMYAFNEAHVLSELEFYDVPTADRPAILKALSLVGMAPYITPDERTRLFGIGIHDGTFSARIIRDVAE